MSHTIADFFPGSFRKPELASLDHVEVAPHHQAGAEIAVLAADRATRRPRRHNICEQCAGHRIGGQLRNIGEGAGLLPDP